MMQDVGADQTKLPPVLGPAPAAQPCCDPRQDAEQVMGVP